MVATAILKIASFGRNSSTDGPISAKFCVKKQNRMPTKATWNKLQIFKIQDGGRPPFWKSLYSHISVTNLPISMKFGTQHQILNPITVTWPKIEIFEIRLKMAFLAITHQRIVWYQRNFAPGSRTACWQRRNFQNPRWWTAAILKIVQPPYLSETIIGFWQNLVYYSIYWTWWGSSAIAVS